MSLAHSTIMSTPSIHAPAHNQDGLSYEHPAERIKTLGVEPAPQRIFDEMKEYEDAARGKSSS